MARESLASKRERAAAIEERMFEHYGPGKASLDYRTPADVDELQKLPGVGRKTANCVMCEAFKDPQGIAVDTHVFRIAHRLKLAGPSADTPQKVEDILLKVYPREQWLFINHQWVHFGREFCRARNPRPFYFFCKGKPRRCSSATTVSTSRGRAAAHSGVSPTTNCSGEGLPTCMPRQKPSAS